MIKISKLQGKILGLVASGVSTVDDLSRTAKREEVSIKSVLALLMRYGLVNSGKKTPGTCVKSYTYTGKPYLAAQCISTTAAAIIEAIDLGYTTVKQINEHTGFVPSLIKINLEQLGVYGLLRKSQDEYSSTGDAYWVKSFKNQYTDKPSRHKWALCDYVCFKMGVVV